MVVTWSMYTHTVCVLYTKYTHSCAYVHKCTLSNTHANKSLDQYGFYTAALKAITWMAWELSNTVILHCTVLKNSVQYVYFYTFHPSMQGHNYLPLDRKNNYMCVINFLRGQSRSSTNQVISSLIHSSLSQYVQVSLGKILLLRAVLLVCMCVYD